VTVYYLCHVADQTAYGGVKQIYRHVDVLNSLGIDAAVVQGRRGFRATWFENITRVVHPPLILTEQDLLVVPEWLASELPQLIPGVPKVVLNQNAYYTWHNMRWSDTHPYFLTQNLRSIICVSDDNRRYLKHAFPGFDVDRVHYSFDSSTLRPGLKRRQVAYMPRKRSDDVRQVLGILHARGVLNSWEVVPIAGLPFARVAEILSNTAVFLSSSLNEGFGMPPAEALACGAYVIGYSGFGGSELFDSRYTTLVPEGDVQTFAWELEAWLLAHPVEEPLGAGTEASQWLLSTYSPERELNDLQEVYERILAHPPLRPLRATLRVEDTYLSNERPTTRWRTAAWHAKVGVRGLLGP